VIVRTEKGGDQLLGQILDAAQSLFDHDKKLKPKPKSFTLPEMASSLTAFKFSIGWRALELPAPVPIAPKPSRRQEFPLPT
jgi:hypothetical protein